VNDSFVYTTAAMGTVVTVQIVGHGADAHERAEREAGAARALAWFQRINDDCTRFDETSELMRLSSTVGVPVPVNALLYEAVQFALAVAEETGGAFDPTVGRRMASRGFNREFRTGRAIPTLPTTEGASFRDVELDAGAKTITLRRPLTLDLGSVAKGLALDLAARELAPFRNFAVDAGGDLFLGGHNADGAPWSVGIRHPRDAIELLDTVTVSDVAVCTSGDYERLSPRDGAGHILDPRTGAPATMLASVTVLAPSAMVADALATAAFVLGPTEGLALLERHGVRAIMVTPALKRIETAGLHT
jgi:thiamine biosynthesis lipoprotein